MRDQYQSTALVFLVLALAGLAAGYAAYKNNQLGTAMLVAVAVITVLYTVITQ